MPSTLERLRRTRHALVRLARLLVIGGLALAAVVGCGTGPGPTPDLEAEGRVLLPPGSPLRPEELVAAGPWGSVDVAADGTFSVPMALAGQGLVLVTDAAGDLVLMGFLDTGGGAGVVSGESTAAALLYLAVGGPLMPGEPARVLELVDADPVTSPLAAQVTAALADDPWAVAHGDEDLLAAVLAARDAVAARGTEGPAGALGVGAAASGTQDAQGSGNVVVTDPGARGGFDLLIGDDGVSVQVQNTLRRPARLLLYRTGTKSRAGPVETYATAQAAAEPVVVPPTRSVELLHALEDAMSGGAPLAPVESEGVELPLVPGTARTYYAAVLLAPSLAPGDVPAVFTDPRFFPYRDEWDEVIVGLQWETWWTSLLFPLLSTMAFGVTGQVAYASLAAEAPGVRASTEPLLAARGIADPLTGDRAKALTEAIERAALDADADYFYELVEHARRALQLPQPSAAELRGSRAYLGTLAKAAGVMAVVDALMASADIVAMLHDMAGNGPAEVYAPVRLETKAEVRPREGQVQSLVAPSVVFDVLVDEPLDGGTYLYRWSTTGEYGTISDYLQEGLGFDSASDEVFYLANEPAAITTELHDEVSVEVYLDDGSGAIAPGAEPVTVATATVVGKERRDLIPGRFEIVQDSYPSGDTTRYCMAAYVVFERQPGATRYAVDAFGFYDPYYYHGHFGTTVFERPDLPAFQPPCDEHPEVVSGGEIYLFLSGGFGPEPLDEGPFRARFTGMLVEVTVTY